LPENLRYDWFSGTKGWSDAQQIHSHFIFEFGQAVVEVFVGSSEDISAHDSVLSFVSYKLFDEILIEAELLSELSFVFLFWKS
jgi:hypothetical protein